MINYIETLGAILLTVVVVFMVCIMAGGLSLFIEWWRDRHYELWKRRNG
jgi:hypothetical protein